MTRRIVLVTPGYPPARGGVEHHVNQLAIELARQGNDVEVLTARRGVSEPTTTRQDGVLVTTYPAWQSKRLSIAPRLVLAAWRVRDADVLHVHSYHALTALALLNRRLLGQKVFTPHYHGGGSFGTGPSPACSLSPSGRGACSPPADR